MERGSNGQSRWSTLAMSSARRPIAATLWRKAVLRRASWWRRTASEMAPISDGSLRGSISAGSGSASCAKVNVGATSVPRGPRTSRSASTTASAPPSTGPSVRSEEWTRTTLSGSQPEPAKAGLQVRGRQADRVGRAQVDSAFSRAANSAGENTGTDGASSSRPRSPVTMTALPPRLPGCALRLERQLHGGRFVHRLAGPEAVECVEPEVAAHGFLDDLAIVLPCSGSTNRDGTEQFRIDREDRPDSGHLRIFASRCFATRAVRRRSRRGTPR